jgi:nitrate/TMAO reductase-like tetraheme cytochrome c subunit
MATKPDKPATRPGLLFTALILVLGVVGGVGLTGFGGTMIHHTNSTEFCTSCHVYEDFEARFKTTSHWANASGTRATCGDCHVPETSWYAAITTKVSSGARSFWAYYVEGVDDPEAFRARQDHLDKVATQWFVANDSVTCRSCHAVDAMKAEAQGAAARASHRVLGSEGAPTCVSCHGGIAHPEPKADSANGGETAGASHTDGAS